MREILVNEEGNPFMCCERFRYSLSESSVPAPMEIYDGKAYVIGCCGNCWVLHAIMYCPFCGHLIRTKIVEENA